MSTNVPSTNTSMIAERSVLGSILVDENTIDIAREILKPADFYAVYNQEIFSVMCHLRDINKPINVVSVYSELTGHKLFEEAGGVSYLVECSNGMPYSGNIEHFSGIVKTESSRRKLAAFSDGLKDLASTPVDDLSAEIAQKSYELLDICSANQVTPWMTFDKVLERACNSLFDTGSSGLVPSGFVDLDNQITGFRPGELSIIAARPGMGKTVLGLNIMTNACLKLGLPVAFFSLEMSCEELAYRIISAMSSVDGKAIRQQKLSDDEWNRFLSAVEEYKKHSSQIITDETPALSISTLKERATRIHRQYGVRMIIIDYLQLMSSTSKKATSREQEIADISRGLKELAKDLHVPVIAMAQINREVENRAVKRPTLSDLRESGTIEQDADKVMFIYREDYYNQSCRPNNEAEIIIAKQRNGPTGIVKLHWEGQFTRFSNLAQDETF